MRISYLLVAALLSQVAYAQLLSVDVDDNTPVTETGFSSFAEGDTPSKVFGAYIVTVTGEDAAVGEFFDRGLPPDAGAAEVRVCGLRIVEVPAPGTVIRIR